jgi:hypothetical protein
MACTKAPAMDEGLGFANGGPPLAGSESSGSGSGSDASTSGEGSQSTVREAPRDEPTCGDGIAGGDEVCDGEDFLGVTCEDFGFASGTLQCDACTGLSTAGCMAGASCGDGVVDLGEQCDGDDLQELTCMTLGLGEGELLCAENCAIDSTGCTGEAGGESGGESGGAACNGLGQGCIPVVDPCCEGLECYGICLPA